MTALLNIGGVTGNRYTMTSILIKFGTRVYDIFLGEYKVVCAHGNCLVELGNLNVIATSMMGLTLHLHHSMDWISSVISSIDFGF